MGFSNTSNLARVRHYEEAHRYFTQKYKPRGKAWNDNERPLGTNAQHHYRIEQGDEGKYYDVILYSTTMARFYAPNAAGETRICYNGDPRNTSTSFMWSVLHVGQHHRLADTEGVVRSAASATSVPTYGLTRRTDSWSQPALMLRSPVCMPVVPLRSGKRN